MSMYHFIETSVEQYMTRGVTSVHRDMTLKDLEALFAKHDFNAFPVVADGKMVGIVTKFDFLKAFSFTTHQMLPHYDQLMLTTVDKVMTENVIDVRPETPMTRALQLMLGLKARSLPVLDGTGAPVGMLSRQDIVRALHDSVRKTP